MENFINKQQDDNNYSSTYFQVDIAKTLGNAYKVFSQLVPQNSNSSFSAQDLANIPYAFTVDKNLNVNKTYTFEEYSKNFLTINHKGSLTFNTMKNLGVGISVKLMPIDAGSIFYNDSIAFIDKNVYKNLDGSVDKGGVLMAFVNNTNFSTSYRTFLVKSETNLLGKLINIDGNTNEAKLKEFRNFMNANKIQIAFKSGSGDDIWDIISEKLSMKLFIKRSQDIGNSTLTIQAMNLDKEYQEMINSNMSLEEFKTKYLDFKQRHDEFVKSLKEAEKAKGIDYDKYPTGKPIDDTKAIEEAQKKRKPIQAESKNKETYKDDNKMNELLKKLLETKFGTSDELEILFGENFKSEFSDDDIGEFNKILSLNSAPKNIDIKA
ncbi:hypothetical protein ELQ16_09180 [Campylobacter sp. US33a]|nr:hypothetical protein [Campylobacter sp. US33a]TEY00510.1 hypothetical protein ELQ16_09180 [Campylobacter sp. US33a]